MRNRVLMAVAAMGTATVLAGTGLALAQSPRGALSDADHKFVMEALEGGQMEVELGRLAEQKAASDAVKQFGQRMATDHAKAGQELAQLAAGKGVEVPKQPARKTQMEKDRLSKATGAAFDREYVKMMVKDHEQDVAAFKRESQQAQDPDLKAWAAKTLPTLEDHLKSIKQIESQVARQ
jgi:putative membrane protein